MIPRLVITTFPKTPNQREIERALSMDFCLSQGGLLAYEDDRPFLEINNEFFPLAISHTKGIHIIGISSIGLDVEDPSRVQNLKSDWIPESLRFLSQAEVFSLGESLYKLNLGSWETIIQKTKFIKKANDFFHEDLGKSLHGLFLKVNEENIISYQFKFKNYLVSCSYKLSN